MKASTKVANAAGVTGAAGSGTALAVTTASLTGPAANLGVYAAANSLLAGTGLAGPGLVTAISVVGGPVVAVPLAVAGIGAVCWGGVKLIGSLFD